MASSEIPASEQAAPSVQPEQAIPSATFRTPRTTYILVPFVVAGISPIALYGGYNNPLNASVSPLTLFYLVPVLLAVYIARTRTRIDTSGIEVRALFGARKFSWDQIRGLALAKGNVYAVVEGGSVRLPNVHEHDLAVLTFASGGRLPLLPMEPVHPAPGGYRG